MDSQLKNTTPWFVGSMQDRGDPIAKWPLAGGATDTWPDHSMFCCNSKIAAAWREVKKVTLRLTGNVLISEIRPALVSHPLY